MSSDGNKPKKASDAVASTLAALFGDSQAPKPKAPPREASTPIAPVEPALSTIEEGYDGDTARLDPDALKVAARLADSKAHQAIRPRPRSMTPVVASPIVSIIQPAPTGGDEDTTRLRGFPQDSQTITVPTGHTRALVDGNTEEHLWLRSHTQLWLSFQGSREGEVEMQPEQVAELICTRAFVTAARTDDAVFTYVVTKSEEG